MKKILLLTAILVTVLLPGQQRPGITDFGFSRIRIYDDSLSVVLEITDKKEWVVHDTMGAIKTLTRLLHEKRRNIDSLTLELDSLKRVCLSQNIIW